MNIGDVGVFDRLARLYDLAMPAADPAVLERGLGLAERDIDRVLDVGGGTGRAATAIDVDRRIVVDAARGMLGQAHSRGLAGVQADAARLPVRAASVDAVLIVDALHHVGSPRSALQEARRVLRPGGVLVVREFDPRTLRGRALVAVEHLVGFESVFFAPGSLAELVAATGLEAQVLDRGFGYTVVGRKPGPSGAETGTHKSRPADAGP